MRTRVEKSKGECYGADVLHQHTPMDESAHIAAEGQRESGRYKPEEAAQTPCCLLMLCNPLHSLLSFHRRCKDTIVLTVLQPHQVCIMTRSLAFIFLSHRISLLLCPSSSPVTLTHLGELYYNMSTMTRCSLHQHLFE